MTTDLCTDDVVVRITTPQTISSEALVPGGGGAVGGRVAASSASVELGRRLLVAARLGDTQQVLDLMAKGAPFTTDWLGTSPLHLAAEGAHVETCAVLVRAGVSRDARTKVERSALHVAACGGHAPVVQLLLEAGAHVDTRDMLRMTPLHWAVQRGHLGAAAALLAHGADPTLVSKFNKTPRSLAAELRRDDLLRAIDDALRQREAANSVHHLVTEQNMGDTPSEEPQVQTFDGIQRVQNIKTYKIKTEKEKVPKLDTKCEGGAGGESAAAAAQLLRRHGITLLPTDDNTTVLNALQSGRTVVLSDAGKLMLKESSESVEPVVGKSSPGLPQVNKNMVLTATPVKSPPKPGMKIFTLNNKLIAKPKDVNKIPVKKIIHPQDMQQVKLVQLSQDAKLVSPSKLKSVRGAPTGARPAVKIIMNKSNFTRLMASARSTHQDTSQSVAGGVGGECEAGGGGGGEGEAAALRAALSASRRALAALHHELAVTRAKLKHYEDLHAS